jgi:hypothetical protein
MLYYSQFTGDIRLGVNQWHDQTSLLYGSRPKSGR